MKLAFDVEIKAKLNAGTQVYTQQFVVTARSVRSAKELIDCHIRNHYAPGTDVVWCYTAFVDITDPVTITLGVAGPTLP